MRWGSLVWGNEGLELQSRTQRLLDETGITFRLRKFILLLIREDEEKSKIATAGFWEEVLQPLQQGLSILKQWWRHLLEQKPECGDNTSLVRPVSPGRSTSSAISCSLLPSAYLSVPKSRAAEHESDTSMPITTHDMTLTGKMGDLSSNPCF